MEHSMKSAYKPIRYTPDLFGKDELSDYPWVFRSTDKSVYIVGVSKILEDSLLIKGFVESESRPGMYHYVVVCLSGPKWKNIRGSGFCECESVNYYGKPCKHILKLRNVFRKNIGHMPGMGLIRREAEGQQ